MRHRHLNDDVGLTSAAIDDILNHGSLADWLELRDAANNERKVAEKIIAIFRAHHVYGTSLLWIGLICRLYGDHP
jgi:hypothetical protein